MLRKKERERDRTLEIEATVVFIKHRIVLLLLLASEETVHYSCWDDFTMDRTRYSSKRDTKTSAQLWGSRDVSPSMLDLRGIQSSETKVKPRVFTHAHQMAAKCNIIHQSGWTVCTGKSFHFSLLLLHQGSQCIWHIVFICTILGGFPVFLFREGNLPFLTFLCFVAVVVLSPLPPPPFLGSRTAARGSKSVGVE